MTTNLSQYVAPGASPLRAKGFALLALSFVLTLALANIHSATSGTAVLSWCETAAFWLGIVCMAGDMVAQMLRRPTSGD